MERFNSHCFVVDPSVKAQGDTKIGFIGDVLFEDTYEVLIDTILQRKSMYFGGFKLSLSQTQVLSGSEDQRMLPTQEQVNKLMQLQRALIQHKDVCTLRRERLRSDKRRIQMFGNQLHSFSDKCADLSCSKKHSRVKLVIEVVSAKMWLAPGMRVTNHPSVVLTQPLESMPCHHKETLV